MDESPYSFRDKESFELKRGSYEQERYNTRKDSTALVYHEMPEKLDPLCAPYNARSQVQKRPW